MARELKDNAVKIQFYWNENYPETLYVMSRDLLSGQDVLYVLHDNFEDDPGDGKRRASGDLRWHRCSWATSPRAMKSNGFELIGAL